jgi:hypothetical protein
MVRTFDLGAVDVSWMQQFNNAAVPHINRYSQSRRFGG